MEVQFYFPYPPKTLVSAQDLRPRRGFLCLRWTNNRPFSHPDIEEGLSQPYLPLKEIRGRRPKR